MSTLTDATGRTSRKVELAGREFTIYDYNINDLIKAEEKLGEDSTQWAGMAATRYLVWLKLIKCEPEITEEEVGEMITINEFDIVTEIVGMETDKKNEVAEESEK